MLVLNTTFSGALHSKEELISFLKECYIPKILAHGSLHTPSMYEIIGTNTEEDTFSFALQFCIKDLGQLEKFQNECFPQAQQMLTNHFGERIVGFITLMRQLYPLH